MNPFEKIDPNVGLFKDLRSPFYGRFRLEFNQVYPFREPTFSRALIKVKYKLIYGAKTVYNNFPQHLKYEIRLLHQKEVRNNDSIQVDCFEDSDWFLCLGMMGDSVHIPIYNYYFALTQLCPYLENCHFFMYSSGDLDTRWIDSYEIVSGKLKFSRNIMETEAFFGAVIYYLKKAIYSNTYEFKRFAAFQLYDLLFNGYDETVEGLDSTIQDYGQMMNNQELNVINKSLKTLFKLNLNDTLKDELNLLFAFDLLDWKSA